MREIRIPISSQAELLVHVTDQMEADYRDCAAKARVIGGDGKDCETCSWWKVEIENTGLCEFPEIRRLLEEKEE